MKTERISIGIFDKQTAQAIREQIKERNLVRSQKVVSVFRGRGSRVEKGRGYHNDLRIQDAEKVSVYLDISTKTDEFALPHGLRERIADRLAEKIIETEEGVRAIKYGSQGLMSSGDEYLVRRLLDFV